jgi:hypothetical protein
VADKSAQLVLDALGRAVAEPAGAPLHSGRNSPGLFPASALGRQAAQRCKDEGLLRVVGSEPRGRSSEEVCALTDRGLDYLLAQAGALEVLEDLVRAAEAREAQMEELVRAARQTQASCAGLRELARKVLDQAHGLTPRCAGALLDHLGRWRASGASGDCPLPELYRAARTTDPDLTVGQFHDALRRLHDEGSIYLHPWTGPLYDLPEPPLALLVGHEVAYYASLR